MPDSTNSIVEVFECDNYGRYSCTQYGGILVSIKTSRHIMGGGCRGIIIAFLTFWQNDYARDRDTWQRHRVSSSKFIQRLSYTKLPCKDRVHSHLEGAHSRPQASMCLSLCIHKEDLKQARSEKKEQRVLRIWLFVQAVHACLENWYTQNKSPSRTVCVLPNHRNSTADGNSPTPGYYIRTKILHTWCAATNASRLGIRRVTFDRIPAEWHAHIHSPSFYWLKTIAWK